MTQIAATVAAIGGSKGIGGHHATKAHGAAAGAGADFAAVVAGLDLTGEGEGTGADALALAGEGAAVDTATGEGETGKGLVVDLALGAAAQSAMADIVAAQPQPITLPVPSELPATAAKGEATAIALDGRAAGRPGWRIMADAAPTVSQGDTAATADMATAAETTADAVTATDFVALVPKNAQPARQEFLPAAQAPVVPGKPVVETKDVPLQAASAVTQAPTIAQTDVVAVEAQPAAPRAIQTGVQSGAAFRQAVSEAAQPAAAAGSSATAPVETVQAAPIFSALPQAVRDPKQTPAASPATVQVADAKIADPAQIVAMQEGAAESGTAQATANGAPVMSALHRAAPEAHKQAGTEIASGTDVIRGRADRAQEQGSGQDSNQGSNRDGGQDKAAATTLGSDSAGASVADTASSSAGQFSDILQSLPPIAASRLGAVTDISPTVTGPADVGATLQGQVIDMGVDGQWIDRMAKEITNLAEGTGHSRFQLNPPNLGRIQIDVWHGENGGEVKLLTETDEAAQRLSAGKSDLQADARLASLSLNSITIERASSGFDSGTDQNPQQQQQQTPQRHAQQGSDQGSAQTSTQTGSQGDNRQGQAGAQANAQTGSEGRSQGQQNSSGQGKSSLNRDVLNERAGTMAQDGNGRRNGDRLVRYA